MADDLGEHAFHNSWTSKIEGQTAQIRLSGAYNAYKVWGSKDTYVSVHLDGTAVAASSNAEMQLNRTDKKGYFTQLAEVEMSLSDPRFTLFRDAPSTTMGQASTSSSTSFNVNESLGNFGPVPVGNIGGGFSVGWSFSRNLTDFAIVNKSSPQKAFHKYRLTASKGAPYERPNDLVDVTVAGQFQGTPLYDLPDIAIANLPLISQAVFVGPEDAGDVDLQILIRLGLCQVEKTFQLFRVEIQNWTIQRSFAHSVHVPVSQIQLKAPAKPVRA